MIFSRQDWLTIIDPQFQYQGFRFFPEILTDTGKMKRKEGDWFKGKVTLLFGWTFGPVTSVGAIHNSTGEGQGGTGRDREGQGGTGHAHIAQRPGIFQPDTIEIRRRDYRVGHHW